MSKHSYRSANWSVASLFPLGFWYALEHQRHKIIFKNNLAFLEKFKITTFKYSFFSFYNLSKRKVLEGIGSSYNHGLKIKVLGSGSGYKYGFKINVLRQDQERRFFQHVPFLCSLCLPRLLCFAHQWWFSEQSFRLWTP